MQQDQLALLLGLKQNIILKYAFHLSLTLQHQMRRQYSIEKINIVICSNKLHSYEYAEKIRLLFPITTIVTLAIISYHKSMENSTPINEALLFSIK